MKALLSKTSAVYKKVKAPGKMVLKRETVEEHLGADFEMDQVHIVMSSCFGFITGLG